MSTVAAIKPAAHAFEVRPLPGGLGAEIRGVAVPAIDDATFPAIYEAFLAHQLLLFRDQELPSGDQVAFARRFGEVQVHVMNQYHANAHPELYTLSNVGPDGRPTGKHPDKGTMVWHTDGSWQRRTTKCTMLYAEVIPSHGGGTGFADMYSAYTALPADEQRHLETLRAIHNLDFSRTRRHGEDPMSEAQRKAVPPVDHPVVRSNHWRGAGEGGQAISSQKRRSPSSPRRRSTSCASALVRRVSASRRASGSAMRSWIRAR